MRVAAVVPAYQAEASVADVVRSLREVWSGLGERDGGVIVVDDGSTDATAEVARAAGADVVLHQQNRGKGAALASGFTRALELGAQAAVTVDADGQHPASQALLLAEADFPREALLLGVRDLVAAGAPRANRFSNRFSNVFLSWFSGRRLTDTQCGLRRYPLPETLALGLHSTGYEFESEVILHTARQGWTIAELPVQVIYPPEEHRVSHFRVVRDPARIVARVLWTVASVRRAERAT
ncbi:MAG TPA: glycosyltransferase family 2 protein [Polyangiaceae bacterium]|nr:glycosyltransferase family 2 protein [Polyangiaceae bacterium]